ncbi:MAG: ferredoxin [Spirochaetia bacterium]|nr:ferredoxin [Spirochaetia bacterium]
MNKNIIFEEETREDAISQVAKIMMSAARTAPKAKGVDHLRIAFVEKQGRDELVIEMRRMVEAEDADSFFLRDALNLEAADGLILIGTSIHVMRLNHCGLCGFANCDEKEEHPYTPCAFNTGDMGIAVGSAVSIAADMRVDNRVMFSVAMAARNLGLLGQDVRIIDAIILSIKGKNIFFDRKRG